MMEVGDVSPNKVTSKSNKAKYKNHQIRKREPTKLPRRENDVYATKRSNIMSQVSKCQNLLDNHSEIVIHGLGAAVSTAVNLALIVQEKLSYCVDIAVNTSTVELLDDFEPLTDDYEPFSKTRSNSAVHILVKKKIETQ